ncbi:hypothetical protein HYPSUDRAFT_37648 [Hypholoma sublateritium FD-334 SS-4]|uniref:Anaphase-promoting complex subunit 5 domain-containing protein n=1 Tax=Hypholoma sublateritium (strain FD-334 SS-4) TaxID=945553 RepID=A0A0D2LDU8_HYPSF|nr:hypothetical protein HYPSUDRAFT_37648 [Hypholoma sublateritium FD-334 SS-4]
MFEDNLAISLLAADCWKKIASLSPTNSLNAWIYLAHKLENVSNSYSLIGDKDGAYTQAREAMNIMIQKKLDCDPSPEVQTLRAQILCIHAKTTRTPQLMNSIELAASAVLTMEGVLRLHNFDKEKLPIDLHPMTSSISSHSMNKSTLEVDDTNSESDFHNSLYSYSGTLLDFSSLQWRQGYISEAHATKKRALVILHFLLLEYPDSQMLLEATASVVLGLCDSTYCDLNSLAENLAYAEEGADIYRKLLKIDFSAYILRLLDTLQLYGQIFREAAMVQDSERIFKEMTALSECASQRYQDLKFPSEIDADYQYRLAAIFYYQDRSSEGIYAAHNAIEQYSALAFLDPDRSSLKLINALIMLCKMLHDTNQHQSAVIEGFKALRLVDNTVGTDKKIQNFVDSDTYFSLIDGIMDALADSPPDPSSLGKASTLITRFKRVFFSSDKFDFKSRTPGMYVEVLDKNGLVDDAISYGQDFLSACERKYSHSNSFESMYSYLYCMEKHIKSLKKNCRIHDALKYSTNMAAIVRPRSHHHKDPSIRKPQYDLSRTHMELLCSVGLYKTALEFTQAAFIKLNSDEGPSVGEDNHYVLHELFDLALMQLHNFLPLQAIETASQAESLSRLEISNGNTENTCFVTMLYYSIYIKSNALFDMAGISQALVYAMEMKDGIQGRDDPYLQSANDRGNCLVSATLARIYFAQNDCAQAKQLMVQVLEMDRKLFEKEKSHFVQLSFDLLFAGIAFCCVDEHEAGVALLIELEDLQRKFSVTHPALAREVEFDLEMQAQRGQWKLIQTAARAKLTCDHVDQTLNLKIAHSDNSSGLEVVEERFHISMPCMYIHRL